MCVSSKVSTGFHDDIYTYENIRRVFVNYTLHVLLYTFKYHAIKGIS